MADREKRGDLSAVRKKKKNDDSAPSARGRKISPKIRRRLKGKSDPAPLDVDQKREGGRVFPTLLHLTKGARNKHHGYVYSGAIREEKESQMKLSR